MHRLLATATTQNSSSREWQRGFKESLPLMIGFVPFALVLGAQASGKGLIPLEVLLLTGLNFGGGSEFAAIGLWTSPPHIFLIVGVTLLVNCRHLLMSATLAPYLQHLSRRRALGALFFMCDESWAMALADAKHRSAQGLCITFSLPYFLGAAAGLYLTWITFTTTGALAGPVLGDLETWGLDMAFPAVFLVLLRGMWTGARAAVPWAASLGAATAACFLLPGAWYVPIGVLIGVGVAWARARP